MDFYTKFSILQFLVILQNDVLEIQLVFALFNLTRLEGAFGLFHCFPHPAKLNIHYSFNCNCHIYRFIKDKEGFCYRYFLYFLKTSPSSTFRPSFISMCPHKQPPFSRFRKQTFNTYNHSHYLSKTWLLSKWWPVLEVVLWLRAAKQDRKMDFSEA